ncbi:MAG: homoserine kinase [Acidimicrobiales bacterium]
MLVSAPASSANLGPGFDCLGLALDLPFRVGVGGTAAGADLLPAEPGHPVVEAYLAAEGRPGVELGWRSPIPPGRGLGFSGAARVAGAYLAARQGGRDHHAARQVAFTVAADLEGHPDNAAASAYGGFVVAVEDRVERLSVPVGVRVVVWWPSDTTSTDRSRRQLPDTVHLTDAAFNIGRTALWVAAMARGDLGALRRACEDRLHQRARLADREDSARTLERSLADPAVLGAWLSGSGPSIATLVQSDHAESVARTLADGGGRVRVVDIAVDGVGETTDRILT